MVINSVSAAAPTQHVAPTSTTARKSAPSKPAAAQEDSAQLSSAAQAALKEATETPAQTSKEASSGDLQAQRLLARESASTQTPKR